MLGRVLDSIQRRLARSGAAVSLALKVRNQCNAVIRYHLAPSSRIERNGEAWLIDLAAPRCTSFVDVGANVGEWAERFLARMPATGRGVCFEPSATALEKLRARLGRQPNVEIVAAAAGDVDGEIELYDLGNADEHTSVVATAETRRGRVVRVAVRTLDAAITAPAIDFLKIDTEGYDARVLMGARELLRAQRIGIVQFEYNDAWRFTGSTLATALQLLGAAGYSCFRLAPDRLARIEYERFGEYFGYSNYVAVAPSHLALVAAHAEL